MSVYIIAEAGVNHNGSFSNACRLIDAAKLSGVDCIKFQTFISRNLVSFVAKKAEYQKRTTSGTSQKAMLKELELSFNDFIRLKNYADNTGITFLSSPFDIESIKFLNTLDMPFWKIPSGEVTNLPYLIEISKTRKPIVMSTGMCEIDEIDNAMAVFKQYGATDIKLLHCNTEYPTPYEDVNLKAMETMRARYGVEIGYSDHTNGIDVPIAAVALGATIIEKHFTLDREMEGPDHKASLEPKELNAMVLSIRNVEKAIGSEKKTASPSERKNRDIARKSIVAKTNIRKGELITTENITVKRPGNGINPMYWFEVLDTIAISDFKEDELIKI